MSATLLLACAAAAAAALVAATAAAGAPTEVWPGPAPNPDYPWGQWFAARPDGQGASAKSADGRGVEVGVAIGVPDPATGAASAFGSPGWTPISARTAQAQGPIQSYPLPAYQQAPPVQLVNIGQPNKPDVSAVLPLPYDNQQLSFGYKAGEAPLPVSEWEPSSPRAVAPVLGAAGGAALVPTPFTQRRVGAFRLRSDRGYQLTMEVPPVAVGPGAPADGVLVMEMRSSLYRPLARAQPLPQLQLQVQPQQLQLQPQVQVQPQPQIQVVQPQQVPVQPQFQVQPQPQIQVVQPQFQVQSQQVPVQPQFQVQPQPQLVQPQLQVVQPQYY